MIAVTRILFLAATLGRALNLPGQTVPAKFADIDAASSVPTRVTKFEAPADGTSAIADDRPDAQPPDPAPANALVPGPRPKESADRFQWKPAFAQYSLEIAIQDAWRFANEPGTRAAIGNGPWFQGWIHSVGETRGWDDGDGWHAGFVGHPLNGAIYGFIERQNDHPLFRQVEWGDGHIYWMSLVRSLAFPPSEVRSGPWARLARLRLATYSCMLLPALSTW